LNALILYFYFVFAISSKLPRPPSKDLLSTEAKKDEFKNSANGAPIDEEMLVKSTVTPTVAYKMPKVPLGTPNKPKKSASTTTSKYFNLQVSSTQIIDMSFLSLDNDWFRVENSL
jgi:hypothetical protein